MPDNSLGEKNHKIDLPRQSYNPGGSGAEILRAIDGRQSPGGEGDQLDDLANPHEIGAGELNLVVVVLVIVLLVFLILRLA